MDISRCVVVYFYLIRLLILWNVWRLSQEVLGHRSATVNGITAVPSFASSTGILVFYFKRENNVSNYIRICFYLYIYFKI